MLDAVAAPVLPRNPVRALWGKIDDPSAARANSGNRREQGACPQLVGCQAREGRGGLGAQGTLGGAERFSCLLGGAVVAMVEAAEHRHRDEGALARRRWGQRRFARKPLVRSGRCGSSDASAPEVTAPDAQG